MIEIPAEYTTFPIVYFNDESSCDGVPRITSQDLDTDANTVTVTFEDGDGLTEIDFTLLNNLGVSGPDPAFENSAGNAYVPTGAAPSTAVSVVQQADPSIPEGSFCVNVTDGCAAGPELYFADPILRMGADAAAVPTEFGLSAAYPNPFASRTTVGVDVAEASDAWVVVYDVLGRSVAVLLDGALEAGRYEALLDVGLAVGLAVGDVPRADDDGWRVRADAAADAPALTLHCLERLHTTTWTLFIFKQQGDRDYLALRRSVLTHAKKYGQGTYALVWGLCQSSLGDCLEC